MEVWLNPNCTSGYNPPPFSQGGYTLLGTLNGEVNECSCRSRPTLRIEGKTIELTVDLPAAVFNPPDQYCFYYGYVQFTPRCSGYSGCPEQPLDPEGEYFYLYPGDFPATVTPGAGTSTPPVPRRAPPPVRPLAPLPAPRRSPPPLLLGDCCVPHSSQGCDFMPCEICVCTLDLDCCNDSWRWDALTLPSPSARTTAAATNFRRSPRPPRPPVPQR